MISLRLACASLVMLYMITATHSYDIHLWDHPLQDSDVTLSPIEMFQFLERPSHRTVCGCSGAPKQAHNDAHHGNTMNAILDELQRLEREMARPNALPRNQQSLQLVRPHGCKEEARERRAKEAQVRNAEEQALAAAQRQLVGEAHHRQMLAMEDHHRSEDRGLVTQEQLKLEEGHRQAAQDLQSLAAENHRFAAKEQRRLAAEDSRRKVAQEQRRLAAQEQQRLAAEEQRRLAAQEQQRLAAEEQRRLAALEQRRLVEEEQRRLAALEQQMAARQWPVVQRATTEGDVDADIDYDELLRQTLQDAPVKTRGERAEWNLRTGWGRKEDIKG